ncbi:hypothetical protein Cob_v003532 [Colletotrichum orbiculare MAFF 240422]|uniref:Uncharacterized protein n=2 Tax=Colletotrichum orbiculare species complex TaxID=2707354 RepID=N4W1T8_COLOR|nr:hypothetical protein Cob_v003532 [Colletotrichum orbiculare MAFF 240422]TDZ34797.1 hypothetical protein C8035_v010271 [Colletotrichum spinosum]
MFMSAPPRLAFHGSDIFAFEQGITARAQQRFNNRRLRKLVVRNGKQHPLNLSRRSSQYAGAMTDEDWSMANMPDGIQDNFEVQQFRNRYLAGTAGSPFSDPDNCMLFQRMQQYDPSLTNVNKRPGMEGHPWQSYGVPDANDIQSMFAPISFPFGVAPMDDIQMSGSGPFSQSMPVPSPVFSASESAASFGSFSSTGAPNLLDSGSFSSVDSSVIDTGPSQHFEYCNSPFASSSMLVDDMPAVKAAPPSPPPFSEPTPVVFFQSAHDNVESRCHMHSHHQGARVPVLESHRGRAGFTSEPSYQVTNGFKAEPQGGRILTAKPRKELPEKRSRAKPVSAPRHDSPLPRRTVPAAPKTESRPQQPCVAPVPNASERSAKDEYLLKAKREGLTYREIRVKGNFSEAESTLRGRYRTLTKSKEERVRKPEWTDNDIYLLRRAVRKFSKGNDPSSTKIPWKQVAEYIHAHGGTYLFGNATCRKKWDELVLCS